MYTDEQLLPVSALQHFLFCQRRAALVHSERLWRDNRYTIEGNQLHRRVDNPSLSENRKAVRIERAVGLVSHRLGLTGKADLIEFHRSDTSAEFHIHIIEYKRGSPKRKLDFPFQAQLCAQALCVEELFGYSVATASIFYGETHRRVDVPLDESLRTKTREAIAQLHQLIDSALTPLPVFKKHKCERCSLYEFCVPTAPRPIATASRYLDQIVSDHNRFDTASQDAPSASQD